MAAREEAAAVVVGAAPVPTAPPLRAWRASEACTSRIVSSAGACDSDSFEWPRAPTSLRAGSIPLRPHIEPARVRQ